MSVTDHVPQHIPGRANLAHLPDKDDPRPACASLVDDVRAAICALDRQRAARPRPATDVSPADVASLPRRRIRLAQLHPTWAPWELELRALADIGVHLVASTSGGNERRHPPQLRVIAGGVR